MVGLVETTSFDNTDGFRASVPADYATEPNSRRSRLCPWRSSPFHDDSRSERDLDYDCLLTDSSTILNATKILGPEPEQGGQDHEVACRSSTKSKWSVCGPY